MATREIHFDDAASFESALPQIRLRTSEVFAVAESFKRNVHRLLAMAQSPSAFQGMGIVLQSHWCLACKEIVGELDVDQDNAKIAEIRAKFVSLLDAAGMWDMDAIRQRAINIVGSFNARDETYFYDAFASMLSAQVIGAWTLFETVAKDLWLAALNNRPKKLGILVAKEKSVAFAKLQIYDFNIKGHMGDLLE